jgi:Fur family peroxide stress response transcriptional regulator
MSISLNQVKQTFQEKGIKSTLPRVFIFQCLQGFKHHFSAEELFHKVSKKHPGVSLATIYKTLDILVQNKLIAKVVTNEDKVIYDYRTDQHIHLYCEKSKTIADHEDTELENLVLTYLQKKGIPDFSIQQVQINIKGEFLTLKNKK